MVLYYFMYGTTHQLLFLPTQHFLGSGIHEGELALQVGGIYTIAQRIQQGARHLGILRTHALIHRIQFGGVNQQCVLQQTLFPVYFVVIAINDLKERL